MNEQELDKKLAEWRGFTWVNEDRYMMGVPGSMYYGYWAYPEPEEQCWGSCPAFTQSLDACIKWLVPKLKGFLLVYNMADMKGNYTYIATVGLKDIEGFAKVEAETPTLAFCLSVEKLINRGTE